MIPKQTLELAEKLWNYHHVHHTLEKADCILVLGSHDLRVAERAADIYLQGWAPLIIFSGGLGRLTSDIWTDAEADQFAAVALKRGISKENLLIENRSKNTGENILFTQQLLKDNKLDPSIFIVVQKPYMERRSLATFKKWWPEKRLIVTSPQISFKDYPNKEITLNNVISLMVGDLQRIKIYPDKGFQIYQQIPEDVWKAYERLVELGYHEHLIC